MAAPPGATGQEAALAWDQVKYYQYNILNVSTVSNADGTKTVTVVFSVTNPKARNKPYDILGTSAAAAFKPPATLRVDFSWNSGTWGTTELTNTKDVLSPILRTISGGIVTGSAPASAVAVSVLGAPTSPPSAGRCDDAGLPCGLLTDHLTYWAKSKLPKAATGFGRVGIEGHPSMLTSVPPAAPVYASIPVTSVYRDFPISGVAAARRQVVDIDKCKVCHDDLRHGETVVPKLALHGANRNEQPGVCAMCHNPNQTDAAYRTSGAEESIDFKRMIHGIHAGGMRQNPLIIIGRNGSVHDFSYVRFPASLKNCLNCHIDGSPKGTFELPLATSLGSTIATLSQLNVLPGQIDIDPTNDLKISPTAATCSGCHDDLKTRQHMIQKGASFGVTQSVLAGNVEQCITCHGPGGYRDVRKEHDLLSSGQ